MGTFTRLRVVLGAVVLATMATLGTTLATTTTASAEPATADRALHGDACTLSPDSGYAPFYFNFHQACHWHDWCYAAKPYGRNEVGRARCDNGFLSRMHGWCNNRYPSWWQAPARSNCKNVANTYYTAVRSAGWAFFY